MPDETDLAPTRGRGRVRARLDALPGAADGLTATLVRAGLALLALSIVADLLWSWQRRHDELPLTVVCAAAVELALAAGFHALFAHRAHVAAVVERGLLGSGLLAMFFLLPHAIRGDDNVRFADIETLLHHGRLTNSQYSLVGPLISVPVLALGNLVESRSWWAGRFNVIVVLVGMAIAFRLLRGRIEPQLLRRIALVLVAASFLTNRLRDYNAEVLTATLVAVGTLCIATNRRVVAGWAAIVVGTVNTPAAIVALAALAVVETARTRRLRNLLPVVAAAFLIMLESWVRRGGPLVTGYGGNHGFRTIMPYSGLPGFSYPFLLGVAAILFSFGRGLLFFMPGLALGLDAQARRALPERRWLVLLVVFVAGLVAVYAKWWAWYGGINWGPRFFVLAALPASVILATRLHRAGASRGADALTLGVLVLSGWVACAGAIANLDAVEGFCSAAHYQHEQLCWFTPDYSSLWQAVRQFPRLDAWTTLLAVYFGVAFAYLAAPLVASLLRPVRLRRSALAGWRL